MNELLERDSSHLNGTVEVLKVNVPYKDKDTLIRSIDEAGLALSDVFTDLRGPFDPALAVHPTIRHHQGEASVVRDPVSTEFCPHVDGSTVSLRPEATLIVAKDAGEYTIPTFFISPVGLLALSREVGVFRNFDEHQVDSVFSRSAYYSILQSLWLELKPEDERLKEVIDQDMKDWHATTREEMIANMDADPVVGKRLYDLVSTNSITGEESMLVDSGVRNVGLKAKEGADIDQEDLDQAMLEIRWLLANRKLLHLSGITATVTPKTGLAVAFPKEMIHYQMQPSVASQKRLAREVFVLGLANRELMTEQSHV